ncbi:histidine phosphatase family protein [Williamsia deligens]|uniref:Histidine phosphatase family protein n=1 Tax=Williamsia deligens TaxID=321325 RepID=A0ABW3G8N0_9NOCA|nr:histidine phosphatase family protein [Williamsia deligens]MCP2193997.1 Broad specificity phosphatase PhoE [Williamsia deligens]
MGVVYLVRHGQAHAQAYGSLAEAQSEAGGLTAVGVEQARRAGVALGARVDRLDHAVSGSLARQQQTLRHILDGVAEHPDPDVDAGWDEYDLGAITAGGVDGTGVDGTGVGGTGVDGTGAQGARFQARLDDDLRGWVAGSSAGTESYREYRARADRSLKQLTAHAGPGRTVIAVSSAGTISAVLATLWGLDDERWLTVARTMVNTSITKMIVGRSGVSVMCVNDHAHLDLAADRDVMTFR